jgi:hypothetical protein
MSEESGELEEVTADEDDVSDEEIEIVSKFGHVPPQQQTDDPEGVYEEFYATDGDHYIFDEDRHNASHEASFSRHSGTLSTSYRSEETDSITESAILVGVSHHTEPTSHRSDMEETQEFSDSGQTSFQGQTAGSNRRTGSTGRTDDMLDEFRQTSFRSETASYSLSPASYTNRSGGESDTNYNSASRTTGHTSQTTATSANSRSSVTTSSHSSCTDASSRLSYPETNHSNRSANSSSRHSYTETNHGSRSVSTRSRMSSIKEDQTNESVQVHNQTAIEKTSDGSGHLHLPDPSAHNTINGFESVSTGFRNIEVDNLNRFSDQNGHSSRTSLSSAVDESSRSGTSQKIGSLSNRISESEKSSVDNNQSFPSHASSRSHRSRDSQNVRRGPSRYEVSVHNSNENGVSGRSGNAGRSTQTESESRYSNRNETNRSSAGRQSQKSSAQDIASPKPRNKTSQGSSSPLSVSHRSVLSTATLGNLSRGDTPSIRMSACVSSQMKEQVRSVAGDDKKSSVQTSTSSQQSVSHDISSYGQEASADITTSLAILGTMSDAGKSVIAAAICRILVNNGTRVAPFKAQNMSNNASPALLPDPKRQQNLYRFFEKATKHRLLSSTPATKEGYGGEKSVVSSLYPL